MDYLTDHCCIWEISVEYTWQISRYLLLRFQAICKDWQWEQEPEVSVSTSSYSLYGQLFDISPVLDLIMAVVKWIKNNLCF